MYKFSLRGFAIISMLSSLLLACNKDNNTPNPSPGTPDVSATLQLTATPIGQPVPDDFLGFSFETESLTDTTYFNVSNPVFIRLIKNLGNGVIRLGGNSVDKTYWTPRMRNGSAKREVIYADDIDRFESFAHAIGWKVMFGLNLGHGNPFTAANEAKYVADKLGKTLSAFEIGNEPEMYQAYGYRPKYNYAGFLNNFRSYFKAVRSSVPASNFSGPTTAYKIQWANTFAADEGHNVKLLTQHYYRMGPSGNPSVTLEKLLTFDDKLPLEIQTLTSAAKKVGIPYRVGECNSVFGGGQKGISDVFASALWGSEYLFYLAQNNVAGVNFHTGNTFHYTAIGRENNDFKANPLYYSMLLFHQAEVKQFFNSTLTTNNLKLDAFYFRRTDGKNAILIINKDENNGTDLTIKNGGSFRTATVHELYAPSLTSTTGTTLDGATVDNDGNWSSASTETVQGSNNTLHLRVKAASAALIIIN